MVFNVDSIALFKTLSNNPEVRTAVVQQAETYVQSHNLEDGIIVPVPAADTTGTVHDTLKTRYAIHDFLQAQYRNCGSTTACIDSVNAVYPTLAGIDKTYQKISQLVQEDIDRVSTIVGIGWNSLPDHSGWWPWFVDWSTRVLGWLVTAVAISLGAPFWFDLLKRVINLKNEMARRPRKETSGKNQNKP